MPNSMAPKASSMVAGNLVANTSVTATPGETAVDVPKSPWMIRPRYLKYWTMIGSSRPSTRRSSATFAGVERSPSMAVTGPPGSERNQTNSSSDSSSSTRTSCNSRRTVYLSTGSSARHLTPSDLGTG